MTRHSWLSVLRPHAVPSNKATAICYYDHRGSHASKESNQPCCAVKKRKEHRNPLSTKADLKASTLANRSPLKPLQKVAGRSAHFFFCEGQCSHLVQHSPCPWYVTHANACSLPFQVFSRDDHLI
jgi:hypothetical protein